MATVFEMGRYGLVKFTKVLNESVVSIFTHEGDNSPIRKPDKARPVYTESHSTERLRHCHDRPKYNANILNLCICYLCVFVVSYVYLLYLMCICCILCVFVVSYVYLLYLMCICCILCVFVVL